MAPRLRGLTRPIRRLARGGWSPIAIARLYQVTQSEVHAIVNGTPLPTRPRPRPQLSADALVGQNGSVEELASRHGVSEKTIQRRVAELISHGEESPIARTPPARDSGLRCHAHRQWALWLSSQGLTAAEIHAVCGFDQAAVESFLSWYAGLPPDVRPAPPTGPPRARPCTGRPRSRSPSILAETGTRLRVLRQLGYPADRIATILAVPVDAVTDFLVRLTPIRRASLSRPRSRTEQARIRPPRPRPEPPPKPEPIDPAELWRYRDDIGPDGALVMHPGIGAAAVAKQAADLAAAQARTPPPAVGEWVGAPAFSGGTPKLSEAQIQEAGGLLRSGLSYPAVAARFGVSVNTLRRHVTGVGPRRAPGPPADAVRHGPCIARPRRARQSKAKPSPKPDRRRKLSAEQRAEIRALHAAGASLRELATKFGVTKLSILNVIHGRTSDPPSVPPQSPAR